MKQKLIRKAISGETAFTFDVQGLKFFVKNLSDSDAFVSFESGTPEAECIKIPSQFAQECFINEFKPQATDTIYVTGSGEIEVQEVLF